jgi:hypothetical protein
VVGHVTNPESTQMPAAFHPDIPEKLIQACQSHPGRYFKMHPIHPKILTFNNQVEDPGFTRFF